MPPVPTVPTVQISHPAPDTSVINGQPVTVTGTATDRGGTEPVLIERVMIQVDDNSPVSARLTRSRDAQHTIADFTATVIITGAQGPHTITATAANDEQESVSKSVTVFLGPVFQADAPAILLDVEVPFSVDPNDASVRSLLAEIQQDLMPVSDVLTYNGMLLAGPNLQALPDGAITVLRLGLWVEPDGFPVLQPTGDLVLPVLSEAAAAASFALVPLLPRPHRTSLSDMPLAVFIAATGIQRLADAALANSNNSYVTSVAVAMDPPSTVLTQYNGTAYETAFTVTVTEMLATAPVVGANPPVSGPVVATSQSSTIGGLPESVLESLGVILLAQLVLGSAWSQLPDQIPGVAAPLVSDLPVAVPFHNNIVKIDSLPDFPVLVVDWSMLDVVPDGILGGADATIQGRDQSMVGLAIDGPDSLQVPPGEFEASTVYTIQLTNLAPDSGTLTWHLWSSIDNQTRTRTLTFGAFAQSAELPVDFPMPLHLSPGTYRYTLSVDATETCGTDSSKKLTATASKDINVKLPQHTPPIDLPGPSPIPSP